MIYNLINTQILNGWEDPNPNPIVEVHNGINVVRDDLLECGSKIRFIDYLIGHSKETNDIHEWVYASPATGFAQISLPKVCGKYGKKAVLFEAQRKIENLHPYQKKCLALGGDIRWVKFGLLSVTQSKARKYCEEDPKHRKLLPSGLIHDTVYASIIKVARNLPVKPDVIWTVGGSGTINRGLQFAFPNAVVHMVQVGYKIKDIGNAIMHESPYKFDEPVKDEELPPFPSSPTYDAKCWKPMIDWYNDEDIHTKGLNVLFWNVA